MLILTFIAGCAGNSREVICASPYSVIENTCCLDVNNDFVCDKKENAEKIQDVATHVNENVSENKSPEAINIPTKTFRVSRIIDGDTIEIESGQKVRLICVDTPEKGAYYYAEAADFLAKAILDKQVELVKDISETDRYGRLLRYVYVKGVFVNGLLVEKGYAKSYRYPPDTKLCGELERLEMTARNNSIGIWKKEQETKTQPVASSPSTNEYVCNRNAYNCGDFSSHAEAQRVYDACGGMQNDIHKLDGDKDGLACEST